MKQRRAIKYVLLGLFVGILQPQLVFAAETPPYNSSNYGVREFNFSSGDQIDANSASYEARTGIGDIGVGFGTSANFEANAGFVTTDEPYLEFTVNEATVDFDVLSTASAATETATFSIRTYLASGYNVTAYGTPPSIAGGYSLTNLTTQTASSAGTEQFGMNLVANTLPTTFGAAAAQQPDSDFSFGFAASNYGTPNQYRYVSEDIVASSNTSSGQTDFTASYIMNVDVTTPAGEYIMNQFFVAVPSF